MSEKIHGGLPKKLKICFAYRLLNNSLVCRNIRLILPKYILVKVTNCLVGLKTAKSEMNGRTYRPICPLSHPQLFSKHWDINRAQVNKVSSESDQYSKNENRCFIHSSYVNCPETNKAEFLKSIYLSQ